jgi:squalene cyclase
MSSGINLYCSEGEGGAWVDVRGLVYMLGTGGYNKLLRLLGKAGYEIHRSRSSTWVKGKKPCNELIKEINELVEKITSEEGREEGLEAVSVDQPT